MGGPVTAAGPGTTPAATGNLATSLSLNTNDAAWITGRFYMTADLAAGASARTLTSQGDADVFVLPRPARDFQSPAKVDPNRH